MKVKKLLAAALAISMVIGLAACGSTQPAETTAAATEASTTTVAATTAASTEAATSASEKAEPEKITIGILKKPKVLDYDNNALTKWIEETANVEIEFDFFDESEWKSQFNTRIAGNQELPDIMMVFNFSDAERQSLNEQGIFLDLAPYFGNEEWFAPYRAQMFQDDDSDIEAWEKAFYDENGHWYQIGGTSYTVTDVSQSMMYINKVWLDKLGLETPTDFDSLVNVLRAFRDQDPNGNGKADEIPLAGVCESEFPYLHAWGDPVYWLINNWQYLNIKTMFVADDNGQLTLPINTPEFREALINIKSMFDEKLISPTCFTISDITQPEYKNMLWPTDGVQIVGAFMGHLVNCAPDDAVNENLYDYVPIYPFNYCPMYGEGYYYRAMVSADTEHPEACARVIAALLTDEGSLRHRYGEPGVDWEWAKDPIDGHDVINVLNAAAWNGETTSTWGVGTGVFGHTLGDAANKSIEVKDPITEMTYADFRNYLQRELIYHRDLEIAAENNPKGALSVSIKLNSSEGEEISTEQTELGSYFVQALGEFVSGVNDPADDADWNEYLNTINELGCDHILEVYQAAYDRQK